LEEDVSISLHQYSWKRYFIGKTIYRRSVAIVPAPIFPPSRLNTCLDSGHLGSHCLIASLTITIKELHNMPIVSFIIAIHGVCWHKYLRTIHKTMPRQCYFQASWLDKPEFKGWLENVPGCRSSAHCLVCRKVFSVKSLGVSAVSVHGKGQKCVLCTLHYESIFGRCLTDHADKVTDHLISFWRGKMRPYWFVLHRTRENRILL